MLGYRQVKSKVGGTLGLFVLQVRLPVSLNQNLRNMLRFSTANCNIPLCKVPFSLWDWYCKPLSGAGLRIFVVCAGSPTEKVVDAYQLLAAKTISLDEGVVFVVSLPNVVAKQSQRTLSLGTSLTTHPSLLFLIGLLFFSSKNLSEITCLFHTVLVSLLCCSSMRLNGWQKHCAL